MPQQILSMIPKGTTPINDVVSVWRDEEKLVYFLGIYPIYFHRPDDRNLFQLFTAQLIESGACRQIEIIKTFGVSKNSVIRSQRKLRSGGFQAFFKKRQGHKGGHVLTPEVLEQAQSLLDRGYTRQEAAEELEIRCDTLRKAINDGRLQETKSADTVATNKSSRSEADAAAADGMGIACTRPAERFLASVGKIKGAAVEFKPCPDVPNGGVLCALPGLLANGLKEGIDLLGKVNGYYSVFHILLLLSFMSLCRIKTTEKLRGHSPGEFGILTGLDRIPEVRCLRSKMDELSAGNAAEEWAVHLSRHWMEGDPDSAGTLYIDGHVRVYHGRLTRPPRRFVSREQLCLRGTTDYWVNDAVGRPFFVVEKAIDPGLLKTLEDNIVPRLLNDIPNQPADQELDENPLLSRFIIVFDREGYSPAFFGRMWKKYRIACITYHKFPDKDWPEEWFAEHEVQMPDGKIVTMKLAEMGTLVGSGKDAVRMREVRKLTESTHQTSMISTVCDLPHEFLASRMFSRWCQENFFRYMMEHFAIDLLQEYGTESFPDTEQVINPAWRELNRTQNSVANKLRYRRASFAEMTMHPASEDNPSKYQKWVKKKSEMMEDVEHYEHELERLKAETKETPKHIEWREMEAKDKFFHLLPGRKCLMDTIRMIAYRTETSMAGSLINSTIDSAAARRILQDLFVTEADILPEPENKCLRIRVHSSSRATTNRSLSKFFEVLNESETIYPGTGLRIIYELIGGNFE